MNIYFVSGIVKNIKYDLILDACGEEKDKYLAYGKKSVCRFELEIGNILGSRVQRKEVINAVAFDKMADLCYSMLDKYRIACLQGRLCNYSVGHSSYVLVEKIYY